MLTCIVRQALALTTIILVGCLLSGCGSEGGAENEQEKLEREFQESMTGVVLEATSLWTGRKVSARSGTKSKNLENARRLLGLPCTDSVRRHGCDRARAGEDRLGREDTPVVSLRTPASPASAPLRPACSSTVASM